MKTKRFLSCVSLLALLILSLAVVSCGDDDDDDSGANTDDDDIGGDDDDATDDDDDSTDDDTIDDDDDTIDDDDDTADDDDFPDPPFVVTNSPELSSDEIPLESPIVITFSEPMNTSAVEGAFQFANSSTSLNGTFTWDATDTIMTFQPVDPMQEQTTYSVSLTATQTLDAGGQALEEDFWIEFDSIDLWTREYAGPEANFELAYGVAMDDSGGVYACGFQDTVSQNHDGWIRKISKNGAELWNVTYNGGGNDADQYHDIVYDPAGYVIAVGQTYPAVGATDILVGKYHAADGTQEWIETLSPAGLSHDYARGVAVDSASNIYITGRIITQSPLTEWIWVGKYDENLNEIWTDSYAGVDDFVTIGNDIAVSEDGTVAVVGSLGLAEGDPDVWLRLYDSDGNVLWTDIRDGGENTWDIGEGVDLDADGNVYVTGRQNDLGMFLRKYDSLGNLDWEVVENDYYRGEAIDVDETGAIWLAGEKFVTGQDWNLLACKYDNSGNLLWENDQNGTLEVHDSSKSVATNSQGIGVVVGYIKKTSTDADVWVRKYDPDGYWGY